MEGGGVLTVPSWIVQEMRSKVQQAYPNEGCGAVLHRVGHPDELVDHHYQVISMDNVSKDPRRNYSWSERQMRLLFENMERTATELHIIYHSHPETVPEPSEVDTLAAWYPGVHYAIFSLAGGRDDLWWSSYLCVAPGVLEQEEVVMR